MGYIRNVKQTRYVRKAIIAPLRKAVSLLKKHGADVNAKAKGPNPDPK